ncbi:hypothetical protein BpHYR1_041272 [Brachionus plicatilis]|uniref:Uncharacterized protein n=1 Tax=Brachionus plicatilis TaxID=10195 RepID=A0A3M7R271_BRAPC|nr:hypothetical protein BpHYR1_041272 [Brachionus plicatilis]
MAKTFLRELAVTHHVAGKSNRQIYEILSAKVTIQTISRWIREYCQFGKADHSVSPGRPISVVNHVNIRKAKRLFAVKKFPMSVMVWIGVTEFSCTKPHFAPKGSRVNTKLSRNTILRSV